MYGMLPLRSLFGVLAAITYLWKLQKSVCNLNQQLYLMKIQMVLCKSNTFFRHVL